MMKNTGNNPWKGLNYYVEGEVLYGRDKENDSLWHYIANNKQTIVYGKSGIGKTSLLNAGIFPKARANGLMPVSVRLNHNSGVPYITQIKGALNKAGIKAEEVVPVINAKKETLWEYFHRHNFTDRQGTPTQPLIVFDQFEEIFTLQTNENVRLDFFAQLADLFNDVIPEYVVSANSNESGKETVENNAEPDGGDDVVFSFDDFGNDTDDNSRLQSYIESPAYHIVFIIREDFLSYLERYTTYIPVMKNNRYPLLPLNEEQAAEIILKPKPGLVDKDVAKLIIEKVTGRNDFKLDGVPEIEVDSAILSLYLSRLYEMTPEGGKITAEIVNRFSDNIISDFYNDSVKGIPEEHVDYLEDELLTSTERRNNVSLSDLVANGIPQSEIVELQNRRLLRIFSYGGDQRVEYVHDILCPVVAERKKNRAAEQRQRQIEEERNALRIARNKEMNERARKSSLNVLTQNGRRLINNSLDIGEMKTVSIPLRLYPADKMLSTQYKVHDLALRLFKNVEVRSESYQIFSDPLLGDATFRVAFTDGQNRRICTTDGIYAITLRYENNNISEIMFYGKGTNEGTINYDKPAYINGGFCGMRLEYDSKNRETSRTFLDDQQQPTLCKDQYARLETTYDGNDNPVEVRYYKYDGGKKVACKHLDGNYGFRSTFDKGGNEITRLFIDADGNPTTIVSGVYGKRMVYDHDTFQLIELNNTDADGKVMDDVDGCATERYQYDSEGRQTLEQYYNAKGEPCKLANNNYAELTEYDMKALTVTTYYIDDKGNSVTNDEGQAGYRLRFNERQRLKSREFFGIDGKPWANEASAVHYIYDESNHVSQYTCLDEQGVFTEGRACDYDKKGEHIVRLWSLNNNGEQVKDKDDSNDEAPVYCEEYVHGIISDAPIQIRFLDKSRKHIACKEGFYMLGRWLDEDGNITKEKFFDLEGNPMPSNNGVYGCIVNRKDKSTKELINIDQNDKPTVSKDGITTIICIKNDEEDTTRFLDFNGKPTTYSGIYENTKKKIMNPDGTFSKIQKIYDASGKLVDGKYSVEEYDLQGRIIELHRCDSNGNIVAGEQGEYRLIYRYSDNGRTMMIIWLDENGNLCMGSDGCCIDFYKYDERGRLRERFMLDDKKRLLSMGNCYGTIIDFDDSKHNLVKTTTFLGTNGNPANNDNGVAYEVSTYDKKGRVLSTRNSDVKGRVGDYQAREYLDDDNHVGAYYDYLLNKNGDVISDVNDVWYTYREENGRGDLVKEIFLDEDKQPVYNENGDYGYLIEYDYQPEEFKKKRIVTGLNKEGEPQNNNAGYCKKVQWLDENDNFVKEMYYALDDQPFVIEKGCYGYSCIYLDNGSEIVGFLDQEGHNTTNSDGYAYLERGLKDSDESYYELYFDIDGKPAISKDDEAYDSYGIIRRDIEDDTYWYWLNKRGEIWINSSGVKVRKDITQENGIDILRTYVDEDGNMVKDKYGDYGTYLESAVNDDSVLFTCLDANGKPHNNYLGYAYQLSLKVNGNTYNLYNDLKENDVLPRKGLLKMFYDLRSMLGKSHVLPQSGPLKKAHDMIVKADMKVRHRLLAITDLYPRQMGAQHEMFVVRFNGKGKLKKQMVKGDYLITALGSWHFGDAEQPTLPKAGGETMTMKCLPIDNDDEEVTLSGEPLTVEVPAVKNGLNLFNWLVTKERYAAISDFISKKDSFPLVFSRYH